MKNSSIIEKANSALNDESGGISFSDITHAVFKRKVYIIGIIGLSVLLSALYTMRQPNVYEATTTLLIARQADKVLSQVNDVHQLGDNYWDSQLYLETQYKIIQSKRVAKNVVERLHLANDPQFLGIAKIQDPELRRQIRDSIDPVQVLMANLRVEPVFHSRLVHLHYRSPHPALAATIVNGIAEAYIDQNLENKMQSSKKALNWLTDQVSDLKENLTQSEEKFYQFKRENGILSTNMDEKVNLTGMRLAELTREESALESKFLTIQAQYKNFQELVDSSGVDRLVAMPTLVKNPTLESLKMKYSELLTKYGELTEKYKEKHPKVRLIKSKLDITRQNMKREINSILSGLRAEYLIAKKTLESIRKERKRLENLAKDLTIKEAEYNRLLRDKQSNQRLYEQVMMRAKEIDLSSMLRVNNISILDRAKPPEDAILPKKKMNLLVGFVIGIALSVFFVIFMEVMDNTIKTKEEVNSILGVPMLGIVPIIKRDKKNPEELLPNITDIYTAIRPRSVAAECCRTIRTNIGYTDPDKSYRTLLITSSLPKEGKTTIVTNMAITMAQTGLRTLAVDTDLRKPRLHKSLDVPNKAGISDVILGHLEPSQAFQKTDIENLYALTCGSKPPNPAELIDSNRFRFVLSQFQNMFDLLILDSPPVTVVTDATILSTIVDGTLLIVQAAKTHQKIAKESVNILNRVGSAPLGVILNQVNTQKAGYYYYYYQYKHYGKYGDDKKS